ncbi:DUF881 domain-containing protein [Nocardioides daphniae]|uniref:Membrane protein n=1 Tax=Nocardioides daphniae TaxID=402297 RepID=A0ABQ1QGP5_9ACTN|nr:DUF881 domain-containing protein [Nocardioides daphniae]GGD25162.1 membrane protein [Nocardioides daphniae]
MAETPTPGPERPDAPTGRPLPQHVTMPLLTLLTRESMDEGYQAVAERKRRHSRESGVKVPPPSRQSKVVTAVAVAVFGVLVAVAAMQTSRNADVEALGRASLAERIQQEQASVRALKDQAGQLLDANARSEADLRELRAREEQLTARVSRLGARTGYLAVRGPGLRVTVDDAPNPSPSQIVQDDDLLVLVDGLWAAGAEAIAINGQRLTALSSIQNSGSAIHVNVRPLNPPYVVEAIGDPDRMPAQLLASANGSLFYSVARSLGFALDVQDDDNLELPAARVRPMRSATQGSSNDVDDRKESE